MIKFKTYHEPVKGFVNRAKDNLDVVVAAIVGTLAFPHFAPVAAVFGAAYLLNKIYEENEIEEQARQAARDYQAGLESKLTEIGVKPDKINQYTQPLYINKLLK